MGLYKLIIMRLLCICWQFLLSLKKSFKNKIWRRGI